jgi:hypothetical protein
MPCDVRIELEEKEEAESNKMMIIWQKNGESNKTPNFRHHKLGVTFPSA